MPRTLDLPAAPQIVFGVWNNHGRLAKSDDPDYCRLRYKTGWKVDPYYGIGGSAIVAHPDELHPSLHLAERNWNVRCTSMKRNAVRMDEAVLNRVIDRITINQFGVRLYIHDQEHPIVLDRTRGYAPIVMEGPTTGPFSITRVLATHRTFRLDNGESLVFNTKMGLAVNAIPVWLLTEIFGE